MKITLLSEYLRLGLITFLIFSGLGIGAQSLHAATVKGKILDSKSNPIPGVIIRIKDSPYNAISSIDGSYQIQNVPKGNFELLLSCLGYQEHSKNVVVDVEEAVVQLDFLLEESTTDLAGVVVQGLSVKSEIETKGLSLIHISEPTRPY